MFGRAYYGGRYFAPRYFGDGSDTVAPPNFSGPIPDISVTENTGTHAYALGDYFTGATSYSIDPAVETGWTFNTSTGELEIDTDAVGIFGGFTVTGTNLAGSADSNSFSVTVVAAVTEVSVGGKPKRRKRLYVEIDGQAFDVDSYAEAEALLKRAKVTAQSVADDATDHTAKRAKRKKRAVVISRPVISTPFEELKPLVSVYREDIESIYRQIAIDAETRELLRLKLQEEDDEESIFVLLH